jgi:hypothetical protein
MMGVPFHLMGVQIFVVLHIGCRVAVQQDIFSKKWGMAQINSIITMIFVNHAKIVLQ